MKIPFSLDFIQTRYILLNYDYLTFTYFFFYEAGHQSIQGWLIEDVSLYPSLLLPCKLQWPLRLCLSLFKNYTKNLWQLEVKIVKSFFVVDTFSYRLLIRFLFSFPNPAIVIFDVFRSSFSSTFLRCCWFFRYQKIFRGWNEFQTFVKHFLKTKRVVENSNFSIC